MLWESLTVIDFIIGSIALFVYFRDSRRIEPVIIERRCELMEDESYQIRAQISNEGNRIARQCRVEVQRGTNTLLTLGHAVVDSLRGGVMA